MKTWLRYTLAALAGVATGTGIAVQTIRSGAMGDQLRSGAWSTGRDVGTADADAKTRAVVALRGLLALPKSEARYFIAVEDDAGRPLSGKCNYRVSGGVLDARWWSITRYDIAGWLLPNRWEKHSIGSAAIPADRQGNWQVMVGPEPRPGLWIPTATDGRFDLTLRAYHPHGAIADDPTRAVLPRIVRQECRS